MMQATLKAIEYYLPERVLTNEELANVSSQWTGEQIESKTGIAERHIVANDEFASDLAFEAANKLFERGACAAEDIDFLLLCTQSPDYLLPTTACILQDRLGLRTSAGALDYNLGCSGYVYGLGLAKGLIETGQAQRVLLITADTYSRFIQPDDMSVRTLFGDAAAATLVVAEDSTNTVPAIGPFQYGTDGRGAANLIAKNTGVRGESSRNGDSQSLYMNGPEIFTFTLKAVPILVNGLLSHANIRKDDVQMFVLHQANQYMLEKLRRKIDISPDKFPIAMRDCGNTVSSTIPIALKRVWQDNQIHTGDRIMLVGFGVGYSWGATLIRWEAD